jgi:hypothetical protein
MKNDRIPPKCEYCELGKTLENERVLCPKKGVVLNDYSCGRYIYDPLKRIPRTAPELPKFTGEDFAIK